MAMKLFKNPAVKHYFKMDLKKNSKFFIICLALHMLSFPLLFITLTYDAKQTVKTYNDISAIILPLAIVLTGAAFLVGIIIAICNYSYLHKKHESDTYMSLPLSDKQRFLTDYFSGLVAYVLPFIISSVFTFITAGIFTATITGDSYHNGNFSYEPIVYDGHTIHWFEWLIVAYVLVTIAIIMFYTIAVLACTLCGSIFETIIHTVILNGAIPGMIALLTFIMFNRVPGVRFSDIMLPILSKTSPIGAAISYFMYSEVLGNEVLLLPFVVKFASWLVVFTVAYICGAYLLYKIRKAEDVAKPYVFKSYYFIIITCITFAVCSAIPIYTELMIIPMIIIAFVIYLAFEVITKRGFKKFGFSLLRCFATIAGSILLVGLLNNPWGFGIGNRVPSVNSVKSVSINYMNIEIDSYYWETSSYTDKDAIETIIKVHEKASERVTDEAEFGKFLDNYDPESYYSETVITYKLKNGTTFTRAYNFSVEERKMLINLETTDEYAEQMAEFFNEEYKFIENSHYTYFSFRTLFNVYNFGVQQNSWWYEENGKDCIASTDEYKSFVKDMTKAIELDLKDRTIEQIRNPHSYYGYFSIQNGTFYVYEHDENILSVLAKYEIYNLTPELELNVYGDKCIVESMYIRYADDPFDERAYNSTRYFAMNPESDRVRELMKQLVLVGVPYNYESDMVYNLNYYGIVSVVVPPEYEHLAKELYSYGSEEWIDWNEEEYYHDYYDDEYYY